MNISEIESRYTTEIVKYRALLEQGALNESEYQELVQDFLDIETIKKNLLTEADKIQAERILKGLIALAGVRPK